MYIKSLVEGEAASRCIFCFFLQNKSLRIILKGRAMNIESLAEGQASSKCMLS
jgi:hypothetical protein